MKSSEAPGGAGTQREGDAKWKRPLSFKFENLARRASLMTGAEDPRRRLGTSRRNCNCAQWSIRVMIDSEASAP